MPIQRIKSEKIIGFSAPKRGSRNNSLDQPRNGLQNQTNIHKVIDQNHQVISNHFHNANSNFVAFTPIFVAQLPNSNINTTTSNNLNSQNQRSRGRGRKRNNQNISSKNSMGNSQSRTGSQNSASVNVTTNSDAVDSELVESNSNNLITKKVLTKKSSNSKSVSPPRRSSRLRSKSTVAKYVEKISRSKSKNENSKNNIQETEQPGSSSGLKKIKRSARDVFEEASRLTINSITHSIKAKKAKIEDENDENKKNGSQKRKSGTIDPTDIFFSPRSEIPERLSALNKLPIPPEKELIKNSWNQHDTSPNIMVLENGHTLHRHPVAQTTDAIRGKKGYRSGIHAIEFIWEHSQRGTHAAVGLCTEKMPLDKAGYHSLVGNDNHSWGWDLTKNKLFHGGMVVKPGCNSVISSEKEMNAKDQSANQNKKQKNRKNEIYRNLLTAINQANYQLDMKDQIFAQENENETPGEIFSPIHNKTSASNTSKSKNNQSSNKKITNLDQKLNSDEIANFFLGESHYYTSEGEPFDGYYPNAQAPNESVPVRVVLIVDCDNGWIGYCANGKWLGIAFSNLKKWDEESQSYKLPGPLYPVISCVWGNCEVSMKPLVSIYADPPSLKSICRKAIWKAAGGQINGLQATENICRFIKKEEQLHGPLTSPIKEYLLAPAEYDLATRIYSQVICSPESVEGQQRKEQCQFIKNIVNLDQKTDKITSSSRAPTKTKITKNNSANETTKTKEIKTAVRKMGKYKLRSKPSKRTTNTLEIQKHKKPSPGRNNISTPQNKNKKSPKNSKNSRILNSPSSSTVLMIQSSNERKRSNATKRRASINDKLEVIEKRFRDRK